VSIQPQAAGRVKEEAPTPAIPIEEQKELRDSLSPVPTLSSVSKERLKSAPLRRLKTRRPVRKQSRSVRSAAVPKPDPDIFLYSYAAQRQDAEKGRFKVHGRLFDIRTGKPVAGARVIFRNRKAGTESFVLSGKDGAYHAFLGSSVEGYSVWIVRKGFSPRYVEDYMPSLRKSPKWVRRDVARAQLKGPRSWTFLFGQPGDTLAKDFALIGG